MNARELRAKRAELLDVAKQLIDTAEGENRDLSEDEAPQYEQLVADAQEPDL